MTDFEKQVTDTTDTFYPLRPINIDNNYGQTLGQVQELISKLTEKKSQLKQLKIEGECLRGRYDQQDKRLNEIKISIGYQVEKEELQAHNYSKYLNLKKYMEEDIKKLLLDIDALKDQLTLYYDDILKGKREKEGLMKQYKTIQLKIKEIQLKNREIQLILNEKQEEKIKIQNQIRATNQQITKYLLEIADLQSLEISYNKKITIGKKQLHSQSCKNRQLNTQIQSIEDKIYSIRNERTETIWNYQKIQASNRQIQEVNDRLKNDLQSVNRHLQTIKKTNEMLKNHLEEYTQTAQKVAKIVLLDNSKLKL